MQMRDVPPRVAFALEQAGVHPLLARLLAARGVRPADELDDTPAQLLPPATLRGADEAAGCWPTPSTRVDASASSPTTTATAPRHAPSPLRGLAPARCCAGSLHYVVPDRRCTATA